MKARIHGLPVVGLVGFFGLINIAGAARAGALTYGWKPGDTESYDVRIEAQEPAYTDSLQGTISYTVKAGGDVSTLAFQGTLAAAQTVHPGKTMPPVRTSRLAHLNIGSPGDPEIKADAAGRPTGPAPGSTAPFSLGSLTSILIPALSQDGKNTWTVEGDRDIPVQPLADVVAASPPIAAHERILYTIGDTTGDTTLIQEQYELTAKDQVRGVPRVRITGDGQIAFDTKLGLPRQIDLKAVLTNPAAAGSEQTPITVSAKLTGSGAGEAAKPRPRLLGKPKPNAEPLSDAERELILVELKVPARRQEAVRRLQEVAPDDHYPEVAEAIAGAFEDPNLFVRWGAVDALKVWATTDSIPVLIKELEDPEHAVRWADLEALGQLQDPRAAEPLAHRLLSEDRGFVEPALIKLGPPSGPAVVPYLQDTEWTVRLAACHVLRDVGTMKEAPALQRAMQATGLVGMAAKEALQAIYQRRGQG